MDIQWYLYLKRGSVLNVLTFMDSNDVGVIERRHYFNLSPDMDKILLILYFVFPDRLDGNLENREFEKTVTQKVISFHADGNTTYQCVHDWK